MKTLKVYDPAMCCSSGVCGTSVDPKLVEFAGALKQAETKGVAVERYNLSQEPQAFVANAQVSALLGEKGSDALPFIFVDSELAFFDDYPSAGELAQALGIDVTAADEKGCCCKGGCC